MADSICFKAIFMTGVIVERGRTMEYRTSRSREEFSPDRRERYVPTRVKAFDIKEWYRSGGLLRLLRWVVWVWFSREGLQ